MTSVNWSFLGSFNESPLHGEDQTDISGFEGQNLSGRKLQF